MVKFLLEVYKSLNEGKGTSAAELKTINPPTEEERADK